MSDAVHMDDLIVTGKWRAIVCFGPASPTSGLRPAEYYQVVIDPAAVSPGGEYIRFGMTPGDEIQGWQRIGAMTICEVLEKGAENDIGSTVVMRAITQEAPKE